MEGTKTSLHGKSWKAGTEVSPAGMIDGEVPVAEPGHDLAALWLDILDIRPSPPLQRLSGLPTEVPSMEKSCTIRARRSPDFCAPSTWYP
jgi:hypothetical protein